MRRLEEVKRKLESIGQIGDIVAAMRGLAAAHSVEAQNHLAAIAAHETIIANAISEVLSGLMTRDTTTARNDVTNQHLLVVLGAEQGFAGAYNDKLIEAALRIKPEGDALEYFIVGQRAIMDVELHAIEPVWSTNMISRVNDAASLASRIVDALFTRIEETDVFRVSLVSDRSSRDQHDRIEVTQLLPFDFGRFPRPAGERRPVLNVKSGRLLENLVEEYVFTEICQAVILAFAAENNARMRAMTRAQKNVGKIRQDLRQELNQSRQEETTMEIIELSESAQ